MEWGRKFSVSAMSLKPFMLVHKKSPIPVDWTCDPTHTSIAFVLTKNIETATHNGSWVDMFGSSWFMSKYLESVRIIINTEESMNRTVLNIASWMVDSCVRKRHKLACCGRLFIYAPINTQSISEYLLSGLEMWQAIKKGLSTGVAERRAQDPKFD